MKKLLAVLLAVVMVLSLVACGNTAATTETTTTDTAAADTAATEEAATEEEAPAEEAAAEEAVEVTTIKVGISTDSMPNCYLDENGNLAGENYEVMCLVDEALPQYEFEYEALTQDVILTGMDTGTYQVGIFNAWRTEAREEKYLFPTYPVAGGVQGIICRADSGLTGGTREEVLDQIAAAGYVPVPVSPGDSSDTVYATYNESHDPQINYQAVEEIDVSTSTKYIMQERYDVALFLMANYTTIKDDVDPDGVTEFIPFNDGGFGTWVIYTKDATELVEAVDSVMAQLYADGTMAAISQKYYGENVFQYVDGFEYADVTPNPDYAG